MVINNLHANIWCLTCIEGIYTSGQKGHLTTFIGFIPDDIMNIKLYTKGVTWI